VKSVIRGMHHRQGGAAERQEENCREKHLFDSEAELKITHVKKTLKGRDAFQRNRLG